MNDFKPGERIELVHTDDQFTTLRPGDRGTVKFVTAHQIDIAWDNGSTLGMIPDAGDRIRKVGS